MTEQPKKRGRPSKADIAARQPVMNGDTSRASEEVIEAVRDTFDRSRQLECEAQAFPPLTAQDPEVARIMTTAIKHPGVDPRAQAYAIRVWNGQAADLKRAERIARCERALAGQNLPTDGIRYPGSDDDEEWDEADMQPVTWRKRS